MGFEPPLLGGWQNQKPCSALFEASIFKKGAIFLSIEYTKFEASICWSRRAIRLAPFLLSDKFKKGTKYQEVVNEPRTVFQELRTALHREGFTPQPEQDELLPVEWDGLPLCRITADGGVRYWQEDVATPERERACERATDLACTVREYMTLLEQAPPLQAQSLTGDYRLLADFNGAVLAAHPTRLGVQFVTWDWSFDRTGLNQGNYFQENYAGTKQDFAIRAGLISKQQIFNQEQLIEIYRCCSDTLDAGFDLTAEQEKCIRGIQEQIAIAAPDALDRIREQEQHLMEPYNQEPIM